MGTIPRPPTHPRSLPVQGTAFIWRHSRSQFRNSHLDTEHIPFFADDKPMQILHTWIRCFEIPQVEGAGPGRLLKNIQTMTTLSELFQGAAQQFVLESDSSSFISATYVNLLFLFILRHLRLSVPRPVNSCAAPKMFLYARIRNQMASRQQKEVLLYKPPQRPPCDSELIIPSNRSPLSAS